ncbi:MAG: sensor histidine kinase, partial [Ignavibacteria bacterium]
FKEFLRMLLHFSKINTTYISIFSVILVILIGFLDYLTGTEISFSIFYLIPITFITYKAGKNEGLVLSFFSAVIWLICDVKGLQRFSNAAIPYWNALVRLMFFIFIVYLISFIRKLNTALEEKVKIRTTDLEDEITRHRQTLKEVERKSRKLSNLAKRVQGIKDVESKKLAREIHDELGQEMTAMKIDIYRIIKKRPDDDELTCQLSTLSGSVDNALNSIRELSKKLRPRFLDELGLVAAIEWQLKELQSKTGINTQFNSHPEELNLRNSCSDALFRIFQEAVTNVVRHAKASSLCVNISCNGEQKVKMLIEDDGIGMTRENIEKENSLGILGMKERAQLVGGEVFITSDGIMGTKVEVTIPIKRKIYSEL